jgi:hypothetical protein
MGNGEGMYIPQSGGLRSPLPPRFLRKEPMAEKNPEEKGKHMGFRLEAFDSSS